ncbi:MAG: hypothetical protein H7337_06620 [Rhizobacter sp.]|nr:hypothetical protein [Rhizobacter sp.]
MTREQVAMAAGDPNTSENPRLDAPTWRHWRSMNNEFQVPFGADGGVTDVARSVIVKRATFEK